MEKIRAGTLYIGTSGLLLPVANKLYYPEAYKDKSRLEFYSSLFSSIEINSSFYKIPMAGTVRRWRGQVPDHFRFTFKLFKGITHSKHLIYDRSTLRKFLEVVSHAEGKMGCLLIQFPASLNISDITNLELLLEQIRSDRFVYSGRLALEFRNAEWYSPFTYQLARKYNACLVIHDKANFGSGHQDTCKDTIYLRFHGPDGNYRDSYDDSFLQEYATYIQDWLLSGKDVYVYFNNTMGNALDNLNTLDKAVKDLIHAVN